MPANRQQEFHERCDQLANVEILTFDNHFELLMEKAIGIVAMGGYNTFCEILSLDKPALIVPRSVPRQEQLIRAERALRLGLVEHARSAGDRPVEPMADALRALPQQPRPSTSRIDRDCSTGTNASPKWCATISNRTSRPVRVFRPESAGIPKCER